MNKKKIWLCSSNLWNSAVTEYVVSLGKALQFLEYKVICSPIENTTACDRLAKELKNVSPIKNYFLSNFFSFLQHLNAIKPEFIFTFGGKELSLALLARKWSGAKYKIIRLKGDTYQPESALGKWRSKKTFSYLDGLIYPSCAAIPEFINQNHAVITLGIDIKKYFFNVKEPTEIYTFSQQDALSICFPSFCLE